MPRRPNLSPLTNFFNTESAGGVILLAATVSALVWANVAPGSYAELWHDEDVQHLINDGLMTLFFFVVGLEIKRELVIGELRDRRAAALPAIAAVGGMVVPALIFVAWTAGTDDVDGWGIPMATDIAFAIGVLTVLGPRVAPALKLFLLTLAIVDDIGAIIVIALFYSDDSDPIWLVGAAACVALILAMRALRIWHPVAYLVPGFALWLCFYESGVHATIAGVILGLLTPAIGPGDRSPIDQLEQGLHPLTGFVIVPLFALANAGVEIGPSALSAAFGERVTWGVLTGLVAGKLIGVSAATYLAVRFRIGTLPAGVTRQMVLGGAALAGIGFTVSLFVAELSFGAGRGPLADAKIGVLLASIVSGVLGTAIIGRRPARDRPADG